MSRPEPSQESFAPDLVLAIDVGNTQIVVGLFESDALLWTARLKTDAGRSASDLKVWLAREFFDRQTDPAAISRCVMVSVVPKASPAVMKAVQELTGRPPVVADRNNIELEVTVDQPDRVGTDRLIDALAAKRRYPCPVIVIDLGTAATISVIDAQGRFIGGTISPGLQTAANALHRATAQLPALDMTALAGQKTHMARHVPVIGTNTEDCIRSGLIAGTAAMLEGMIDRIEDHLGEPASRVVTGGLAGLIWPECRRTLHYEPHLLLSGLLDMTRKTETPGDLKAAGVFAMQPGEKAGDGIGKIGIIGAGQVGITLGAYLISRGLKVVGYSSQSSRSAKLAAQMTSSRAFAGPAELIAACDCVLLAVPDDNIGPAWQDLRSSFHAGQWLLHCSGSYSSAVFSDAGAYGVKVASMHPMFAFTRRDGGFNGLEKACFSLEGDPKITAAWQLFWRKGGHPVLILDESSKTRVHLASVLVANLGLALTSIGCTSLQQLGLNEDESCRAVVPLLQANIDNLRQFGLPRAITGPIDRNDPGTVERHLAILPADQLPLYRMLSRQLLLLAKKKHPQKDYNRLDQLLADPTTNSKEARS